MRIAVDTNVLVRTVVRDNEEQARVAERTISQASLVAIPLACFCEFAWVLRQVYRLTPQNLADAIATLLNISNARTNRQAVEAGLAVLQAGGDFADGVIAYEGRWLGGEAFVSFDRKAIALVKAQGHLALMLQ